MKVVLAPWDPAWAESFRRHAARISAALARLRPSVEHIGSTSLGSIAAKPIVDVLVGLPDERSLDETPGPMVEAGYCYVERFNAGMPYRRFFAELVPRSDAPLPRVLRAEDRLAFGRDYDSVANVHVMGHGTYHWVRHVAFRDYLLSHPDVRGEYEALKRRIAEIDLEDPLHYNSHKEAFLAEHQARALAWFAGQEAGAPFRGAIRAGGPPRREGPPTTGFPPDGPVPAGR